MTEFLSVSGGLSAEETLVLHEKLWALLERTSKEYTLGKESSVSSEAAQKLLASACFVLSQYLKYNGKTTRDLLDENLFEAFKEGQKCLIHCCDEARELWKKACLSVPKIISLGLTETLKSIGEGFYHYNIDAFPSEVPCEITYPLMVSVPENFLGMEYVCEYLRRLLFENYILSRFDVQSVRLLLKKESPYYSELLINLCEAPIQNAVGLALLKKNIFELKITPAARKNLKELFEELSDDELASALEEGADEVCEALGILNTDGQNYIRSFAKDLLPRIKVSLASGMHGVFL